ncbi:chromosome segregation protein Spc25-domain-containing protein [Trichophaea hybrida]|nr:chromosome segregation protein Spc25-domain-containing protein [Trichophaea hybrida]
MAATLPSIDFGFETLRERMSQFTKRFDAFIENGRKSLLEEKNEFAKNMSEDKDRQRGLKTELEYYQAKELEIKEQEAKEKEEVTEAENAIAVMEHKKRMKDDHKESLLAQIEETKLAIEKKRAIRAAERQALALQQTRNKPELEFWEDHLGMKIEGAGVADQLKIIYTHLVDPDWNKEFWFVVSMMSRDYEVIKCRPKLDPDEVTRVVDKLNETREFSPFLKDMRQLFKKTAVGE